MGGKVAALLGAGPGSLRIGSTLLVPELLSKPIRVERLEELRRLAFYLSRLELSPVNAHIATVAADLGGRYRLRAADAVHLATAVTNGADRFITNNRRDFDRDRIVEVDVTYPGDL